MLLLLSAESVSPSWGHWREEAEEGGGEGEVEGVRRMAEWLRRRPPQRGRLHRSSMVRRVGKEGQLNRCWTEWSGAWHSGQVELGAAPMRAWYERRAAQWPDRSCDRVVRATLERGFSVGEMGGGGAWRTLFWSAEAMAWRTAAVCREEIV